MKLKEISEKYADYDVVYITSMMNKVEIMLKNSNGIKLDDFQKKCLRRYNERFDVHWVARDMNGELYGYSNKPLFCTSEQVYKCSSLADEVTRIHEDVTDYPIKCEDGIIEIDTIIK